MTKLNDDILASTGNTAKEQEMFFAGVEAGEANAKNNADVRGADGWLPIESAPKDGSYVLLRGQGDHRIADGYWLQSAYNGNGAWIWPYVHSEPMHWMLIPAEPGAAPAAPVSTVEQDERQAFEAWAEDQGFVLDCDFFEVSGQYYDQDDTQLAYDIWRAARASAPAAGDALDAARWRSFRSAITRQDLDWLERMDTALLDMGCDVDSENPPNDAQVDAAADAAIAAQQGKGGAA